MTKNLKSFIISAMLLNVIFIFSCSKNNMDNEEKLSQIIVNNLLGCQQVFSIDNNSVPYDIRKIGYYHNEIISKFERFDYINNKCDYNEYDKIQLKLDFIINNDNEYKEYFQNISTTNISYLYLNELKICNPISLNTNEVLHQFILKIDSLTTGLLNPFERNFINAFFTDVISSNEQPIIDYVRIIEKNSNKFINNGLFSLGILSIYDNSFCYWENKNSNNLRACPPCVAAAAMDAIGAFYEGSKDLYEHRGRPGPRFLKRMGRGALSASIPIVGGDIASWFGW